MSIENVKKSIDNDKTKWYSILISTDLYRRGEAEIEVDIKAQDWYIEAKRKLDFEIKKIWRIEKWRITKYINQQDDGI